MRRMLLAALCFVFVLTAAPSWAIDVGSDGSDGVLSLTGSGTTTINLGLAVTGTWDSPGNGNGVYDSAKWAIVFKYTSVNIAAGRTVQFTNHPSGAPVVWLVQGDVAISGTVLVNGQPAGGTQPAGGPGGFRGGKGYQSLAVPGGAGLGPGGGQYNPGTYGSAGGYATAGDGSGGGSTYGNPRILPLIGGSGGAGSVPYPLNSGGGGGGAILVAANGTLTLGSTGAITANGGPITNGSGGGGSGGAIRLVAANITGPVTGLAAYGQSGGGQGRIRLETDNLTVTGSSNPWFTWQLPLDPNDLRIWPVAGSPAVRVTTVGGVPVPADPGALLTPPGDLYLVSSDSVSVALECTDVPVAPARRWGVSLRMVRRVGAAVVVPATYVDGDSLASTWIAKVPPLPDMDFVALQARAHKP